MICAVRHLIQSHIPLCRIQLTVDLSQKSPYHAFSPQATLRALLPLFASGIHRVAIDNRVLTDTMVLQHLITKHTLVDFTLPVISPALRLSLHPVVSLPGTASVLDAMRAMNHQGLSALGILPVHRSQSSGDGPNPFDAAIAGRLLSVVTVKDCTSLVVPSQGNSILGMGLEQLVQQLQVNEPANYERFPIHTISPDTSLLRASHLILATASSRVFVRTSGATSPASTPPLSPGNSVAISSSPPTHFAANQVLSILDILSSLAKAYHLGPPPESSPSQWDMDPAGLSRRRRLSNLEAVDRVSLNSWRWNK